MCFKFKLFYGYALHIGIHKSSEVYLEAILIQQNKLGYIRNVGITEYVKYSKPSITYIIIVLRNASYVRTDSEKIIMQQKKLKH